MARKTVAEADVTVLADVSKFAADLKKKLRPILKTITDALTIKANIDVDDTEAKAKVKNFGRDSEKEIEASGDRAGKGFSNSFTNALSFKAASGVLTSALAPLGAALSAVKFSVFAGAAAAAGQQLLHFGAALAPAVGIVAALPAVLAVGAAALIPFKVGLSGVGDAFSAAASGDAEKFAESIKKLAPAAKAVATEFFKLQPALTTVRNTVQQALFAPLVGQLTDTANVLKGPVAAGMAAVAGEGGKVAASFLEMARSSQTVVFLQELFRTTAGAVGTVGQAFVPLIAAFRDLAGVGLPSMTGLANAIASVTTSFATFISGAVESGQALQWIENAKMVFSQLGNVALQVGGILEAVFRAAGTAGGDVLGVLGQLLTGVNAFLSSAEGQTALVAIFQAIGAVGTALQPIITAVGTALGNLAPIIAQIATAAGPALETAITAIGEGLAALGPSLVPVIEGIAEGFKAIAPALGPLGASLGKILEAAAPLLPVIGDLVGLVGANLATAFTTIATAAGPVIEALANSLAPVFPELAKVAGDLAPVIAEVAGTLGGTFADALTTILPPLVDMLPGILRDLMPAFTDLVKIIADLAPQMAPVIKQLVESLLPLLPQLIPIVVDLLNTFTALLPIFLDLYVPLNKLILLFIAWLAQERLVPMLEFLGFIIGVVADHVVRVAGWWGKLIDIVKSFDFSKIGQIFQDLVTDIVSFVTGIRDKVIAIMSGLVTKFVTFFGDMITQGYDRFVSGFNVILDFVTGIPQKIIDGLITLGEMLGTLIRDAWERAKETFIIIATAMIDFVKGIPQKIIDALINLSEMLYTLTRDAWNRAKETFIIIANAMIEFVKGIPGKITGALSNLANDLYNLFTNAFNRVTGAVRDGIQTAINFVKEFPSQVLNTLSGLANSAYQSGQRIVQQLIDGLKSKLQSVKNAASSVASAIRDYLPFSPAKEGPFSGSHAPEKSGEAITRNIALGMKSNRDLLRQAATQAAATINTKLGNVIAPTAGIASNHTTTTNNSRTTTTSKTIAPIINITTSGGNNTDIANTIIRRMIAVGV